jgi:hypothetical protein
MELFCPTCKSRADELIECANCKTIGCPKCIRKKHGKWVCHKCPESEYKQTKYYYPKTKEPEKEEDEISNAFSAMFG